MRCRRLATACSIPIPSIGRARCRRCWRRRSRGRACAGPAAISPPAVCVVEAGRRVLPRDLLIARAAGMERLKRAPAAPAHRQCSLAARVTARSDRGERAQPPAPKSSRVTAAGRDAGFDCRGTRWRRLRSAADRRRQRRRPHRRGGDGAGGSAARLSPTALRCSPAAPRPSAASARRRSSCCRARRIRPLRHGGRWRFRCSIACRAGGRARRSICRWRARLHPASASPRSCCWSESRAPG